jgi:hypothetical protein
MKDAFSLVTSASINKLKATYQMTWEDIFRAQFGGTIIAKLYNGT